MLDARYRGRSLLVFQSQKSIDGSCHGQPRDLAAASPHPPFRPHLKAVARCQDILAEALTVSLTAFTHSRNRPTTPTRHGRLPRTTTGTSSKRSISNGAVTERQDRCDLFLIMAILHTRKLTIVAGIGSGANWNFNLPVSGTPGMQGSQQRSIGTMSTFAQSLSGSQPTTPLDLS